MSSNDTKFGVDLEHKIPRHMMKILAKLDDRFQSYSQKFTLISLFWLFMLIRAVF